MFLKIGLSALLSIFTASLLLADTHWATSPAYDDVLDAYLFCDVDDILAIPAGTAPWRPGQSLTVDKTLTIQGAGIGQTIIYQDRTISPYAIFVLLPATGEYIRMTGIELRGAWRKTVTASAATNVFTSTDHMLQVNDPVKFTSASTYMRVSLSGGSPLVTGTTYYILTVPSAGTFTLSTSAGGSELDITTDMTAGSIGLVQDTGSSQSVVSLSDKYGGKLRVDNCAFYELPVTYFKWRDVTGVIDNCQVQLPPENVRLATLAKDYTTWGDKDWELPAQFGSDNALYVEQCNIVKNGATSASGIYGLIDTINGGGRAVIRKNFLKNTRVGTHGTESGNRYRSGRKIEFYQNEVESWFSPASTVNYATDMRGGAYIGFSNKLTGVFGQPFHFANYRLHTGYRPWGSADGTKLFDIPLEDDPGQPAGKDGDLTANDGIYDSGTCTLPVNDLDYETTYPATVTQSGTTITASTNVFTAGMVGRDVIWVPWTTTNTPRTITAYISPTQVTCTTSATRATPSYFRVGKLFEMDDSGKSWTPDEWIGYTLRQIHPITATSGGLRTVTVSGTPWIPNMWGGWTVSRVSNDDKGVILSNTENTLTLSTGYYPLDATGGGDFVLSWSGLIEDNTSTTLTAASKVSNSGITEQSFKSGYDYEIRKLAAVLDMTGMGPSREGITTSSTPNNQSFDQTMSEPAYLWDNRKRNTPNDVMGTTPVAPSIELPARLNVNIFSEVVGFDGSAGVGIGPIGSRPISPSLTNVGWWATDEGDWDLSNDDPTPTADGQLYTWNGSSWVLYYEPLTYPHPLRSEDPPEDVFPPTIASASINGGTISLTFSEPITGGASTQFSLSSSSLSVYAGTGNTRTMTVNPAAEYNSSAYTLNWTPGDIQDLSGNTMLVVSGFPVINNTSPPTETTSGPGRKGRGPRAVMQGR